VVKQSVLTFAYKIYSNSGLQDGRFFLSKMVLRNTGKKPVRDFSVSYQIPGYVDWTTPDSTSVIEPGHTAVELYYPQFPMKVTQIKNLSASVLEIKLHWNDGNGPAHEEIVRENFNFRGVNEIEYTDLPKDELVNWFDLFSNSDLVAAMVTPNDPVVTEFAAAITEKLGGAVAGAGGPKEAVEVLRGTYDYMTETGMRYAGSLGFPATVGDVSTLVQVVRLPRDVIISNNGLCIELALLWASVLDHLGIRPYLILIPGHAFVVAQSGDSFFPVECTAITPKSVGRTAPVSFEDAVKMAQEELDNARQKTGLIKYIDVRELQSSGIQPPELPDIEIDRLKNIIASRHSAPDATRNGQVVQNQGQDQGQNQADNNNGGQQTAANIRNYTDPQGLVRCAYPASWNAAAANQSAVPQLIFTAADRSGTNLDLEVYHTPNFSDPESAMRSIIASYTRIGARVQISNQKREENGVVTFVGRSSSRAGSTVWIGLFRPSDQGAAGVVVGGPPNSFQGNQQMVKDLIGSVQFP
jgi:hypothetical protein